MPVCCNGLMKKIPKLKNLEVADSFIQVNFIKGFSYIDTAGEILNLYQNDEGKITYDMNAQRLVLANDNFPNTSIRELKISVVDLWAKFTNKDLKASIDDYVTEAKKIFKVTMAKDAKRIGIRRNYIFDPKEQVADLGKLIKIDSSASVELTTMNFTYNHPDGLKGNIKTEVLVDSEGKRAILFDIDIYNRGDSKLSALKKNLETIEKAFESKDLLSFVNAIIEEL